MLGWLGLICSAAIVLATACVAGRRYARDAGGRFWIGTAAGILSVSAAMTVLSPIHLLTPLALLIAQLIIFSLVLIPRRGSTIASHAGHRRERLPRLAAAALLVMIVLTGIEQLALPVSNIDDRNYRAARAAYWLQAHSLLLHGLHNDRDITFPPGGSIPFFWAILFSRSEPAGLIATWLAFPLLAWGMMTLVREMRLNLRAGVAGALVVCFTPIVLSQTRGLAPELWLALFTIGCGFWCVRAARGRSAATGSLAAAAVFAVLAINVRTTAVPLLAVVLLFPILLRSRRRRAPTYLGIIAASLAALIFSGLGLILSNNVREYGHPLGSAAFRHVHEADITPVQLRTHLGRMVVSLVDPPMLPDLRWRIALEDFDRSLLRHIGADQVLPMEEQRWPGHFSPHVEAFSQSYSLPGILWLPILAIVIIRLCWRIMFHRHHFRLGPDEALVLLSIPFLGLVVFIVRWMGLMPRFWIAPYALGAAVMVTFLWRRAHRYGWLGAVCVVLLLLFAIPAALARIAAMGRDLAHPPSEIEIDEPYAGVLAHLAPGARILLVAGQASRDYPLFLPRDGFANEVYSWGQQPFDAGRMRDLIRRDKIDDVLIADDRQVEFEWAPPVNTSAMVAWLSSQAGLREIPLTYSPGMRLYSVTRDAAQKMGGQ